MLCVVAFAVDEIDGFCCMLLWTCFYSMLCKCPATQCVCMRACIKCPFEMDLVIGCICIVTMSASIDFSVYGWGSAHLFIINEKGPLGNLWVLFWGFCQMQVILLEAFCNLNHFLVLQLTYIWFQSA